jgi:hypothetical protein
MSRGSYTVRRGQFSLLYLLLAIANASLMFGSYEIIENQSAPDWVLSYATAGILVGVYGWIALAIVPFLSD